MSNPQPDVLSQVSEFIARYLQCSEHQRTILALWVLHTYCFPAAQVTPYLSIRSAHKQSGKTLCLQLLALLCEGSALTSGGFKASDLAAPMQAKPISALLLDECHHTIGTRSRSKGPTLRALLAGSFHLLHGHSNIAQERNAFCPKAFVGQGPLPEELADRSIPIILEPLQTRVPEARRGEAQAPSPVSGLQSGPQPPSAALPMATSAVFPDAPMHRYPDAPIERFHLRHAIDQVQPIRNRLNHWADVHLLPLLDQMSPLPRSAFPPNLSPRQQDIVEPLLQIAGLIGGPWPRRALQAFAIIFDLQTHFDLLPNLQLLADAHNCFAHHGYPQRLSTNDLLDWLHSLPTRPWATEYDGDGPLTAYKLARLLMPFAIRPHNQRIGSDSPARGYELKDFQEPWQKYFLREDPLTPELAARSQQLEASTSEIANNDGLCNTVSLDADHAEVSGAENRQPQPEPGVDSSRPRLLPVGMETPSAVSVPPVAGLAASSQQPKARRGELEASTSEIVNKDAVCSTVSVGGTRSSLSPAAGPGEPWITCNLFPGLITCSPECEMEGRNAGKLENQSHDLANLSTQQIRERKEALMRELSPLFSKPVPPGSSPNPVNKGVPASNVSQNAKPKPKPGVDSRRPRLLPVGMAAPSVEDPPKRAVSAPPSAGLAARSQKLEAKSTEKPTSKPTPSPQPVAHAGTVNDDQEVLRGFYRLTRLHQVLRLQGLCPPLDGMANMYDPQSLHAALDWVDAHPEWSARFKYKPALEFVAAFQKTVATLKDQKA